MTFSTFQARTIQAVERAFERVLLNPSEVERLEDAYASMSDEPPEYIS